MSLPQKPVFCCTDEGWFKDNKPITVQLLPASPYLTVSFTGCLQGSQLMRYCKSAVIGKINSLQAAVKCCCSRLEKVQLKDSSFNSCHV